MKYEYKSVEYYFYDKDLEKNLNQLGGEGWELISASSGSSYVRYIFMREK